MTTRPGDRRCRAALLAAAACAIAAFAVGQAYKAAYRRRSPRRDTQFRADAVRVT